MILAILWFVVIMLFVFSCLMYQGYVINADSQLNEKTEATTISYRTITAIFIIITTCFALPTFYYTFQAITMEFIR